MCHFLFVAVPSEHAEEVKRTFARGFMLHATANKSVLNAIPSGYPLPGSDAV